MDGAEMNKKKLEQKVLDIEENAIELDASLQKLNLLTSDLREDYFCFDEHKDADEVLCYYKNASIKCDMLKDYVNKSQELIKDISYLVGTALGRKLDVYDEYNSDMAHS